MLRGSARGTRLFAVSAVISAIVGATLLFCAAPERPADSLASSGAGRGAPAHVRAQGLFSLEKMKSCGACIEQSCGKPRAPYARRLDAHAADAPGDLAVQDAQWPGALARGAHSIAPPVVSAWAGTAKPAYSAQDEARRFGGLGLGSGAVVNEGPHGSPQPQPRPQPQQQQQQQQQPRPRPQPQPAQPAQPAHTAQPQPPAQLATNPPETAAADVAAGGDAAQGDADGGAGGPQPPASAADGAAAEPMAWPTPGDADGGPADPSAAQPDGSAALANGGGSCGAEYADPAGADRYFCECKCCAKQCGLNRFCAPRREEQPPAPMPAPEAVAAVAPVDGTAFERAEFAWRSAHPAGGPMAGAMPWGGGNPCAGSGSVLPHAYKLAGGGCVQVCLPSALKSSPARLGLTFDETAWCGALGYGRLRSEAAHAGVRAFVFAQGQPDAPPDAQPDAQPGAGGAGSTPVAPSDEGRPAPAPASVPVPAPAHGGGSEEGSEEGGPPTFCAAEQAADPSVLLDATVLGRGGVLCQQLCVPAQQQLGDAAARSVRTGRGDCAAQGFSRILFSARSGERSAPGALRATFAKPTPAPPAEPRAQAGSAVNPCAAARAADPSVALDATIVAGGLCVQLCVPTAWLRGEGMRQVRTGTGDCAAQGFGRLVDEGSDDRGHSWSAFTSEPAAGAPPSPAAEAAPAAPAAESGAAPGGGADAAPASANPCVAARASDPRVALDATVVRGGVCQQICLPDQLLAQAAARGVRTGHGDCAAQGFSHLSQSGTTNGYVWASYT